MTKAEIRQWTKNANEYWATVVKCLISFQNLNKKDAVALCKEMRTALESNSERLPHDDDYVFKWLYMHDSPLHESFNVMSRNGLTPIRSENDCHEEYFSWHQG